MERTFTTTARRSQIVRAAIETIADVGYEKASFARITERAGLSSPRMISYHFADKNDLLRQIVIEVFGMATERMTPVIDAEPTMAGKLRAYLETNLRFLRDHPLEITALTEIGPHLRGDDGEAYTSTGSQDHSASGLAEILADGQRTGEFRDFDTRSMAVLIRASVDAAAQRVRDGSDVDLDTYTAEVVTAIDLAVREADQA
ncbi:TetR/AcrR family transcriptional regulator [Saccharopolyspora dendranthemae]|uniref:TetR family transcriptional regulator n=1 Tax=Saccharopolyspora dendranthemae TaxID=1181886 RepID=A0A561V938_9PSEU|nr:TetR/AcrR family transcriptional regulator [Saccharopolyspora dendranthemae]TWG08118.1 TetR family transcriptional regulator [Saccharopolyspora dendranthemae]